jgi:DNA-binding SARP family transcriptional activator/tetratricopeptide (TPR) repeat protein
VEFFVLGPLEVRSTRKSHPLGGPRQRAVLADLLLHAGSVIAMDTLIDDLWGAAPPPTAEAVVQNAVSRLRKTLGREVIETRPPGYVLAVDPGAVDARRFERLVHDVRPLPPAERSAALRDALALWRGPAFADLAFESFLQDEIARLDELRLTALEDRLEAEIQLGRHDAVVGEASALAARHPARERLCRLLMLALHRAGRQQEALDAYEALRRSLDELFGLEPASETRALQVMILTQDPAIGVGREPLRSVGAVRRPVALLLVELLLDEELELEAAGAAHDDACRALAEVVARHGGALSPESGVELVAAFGAEAAHEDDVLRAARSAVELHEMLTGRDVDARFAVGTGRLLVEDGRPVLVGPVVGETRRALHDADAGDILVTPAATRLGGDALELDADGRLLGVRPGRPRPTAGSAPLVGRSAELAGLRAAFDRVVETGRPQHAVVVGEPGIGKSRLVAAFVEDVPATVLEAACIPYGEGISFLPLRELAEKAVALDDSAPELGDLTTADAALAAAHSLFEHFTGSGPLLVVLDDVHWAVPTFLDLVEYVVRAVDGPLLVVSATRPELLGQRPAWGEGATMLEPLAGDEARCLVDALPEREVLDDKATKAILDAAEGVPLFLEQLAAHAAESDLGDDRIPSSLDALLAGRIDALQPGERDVLSRAAVVGRAFSRESIGVLTPSEESREIDGRLASLGRRRFVRPRVSGHEFVHPLVHAAAYGAIGRRERAQMHERFARWLDTLGEGDELVGTHLERAALDMTDGHERDVLGREASDLLGGSGILALHAGDDAGARNLLERAAVLLVSADPKRLELECSLGHVLKNLGRNDLAMALLEDVAERARALADSRLELRARVEMVWPQLLDGSLSSPSARELLDEAVTHFDRVGDTLGVARSEIAYCLLLSDFGNRANEAAEHLTRADEAYRRLGHVGYTDELRVLLGITGGTSVDELIATCRGYTAASSDRPRTRAYLGRWLAYLLALRGDLDEARTVAAAARHDFAELGEELALGIPVAMTFGSIEAFAGEWDSAESIFRSALEYIGRRESQSGSGRFWRAWRAYFLLRVAQAALARGNQADARNLVKEARPLVVVEDALTSIWLRRITARVFARAGNTRKATGFAREGVSMADATDDLVEQGEARLDLAEVLLCTGATRQATTVIREGVGRLDAKGATLLATNGRMRFADILKEVSREGTVTSAPSRRRA